MSDFSTINSIQMSRQVLGLAHQIQMDRARESRRQEDYDAARLYARGMLLLGALATLYFVSRRR